MEKEMTGKKKSKMPQIGEAVFCIVYLAFGFVAAILMITGAQGREVILTYGILTLVLAGGDSFHLVPRIINAFSKDFKTYEFWAGLGLLVSSITMTIFYLILYRVWELMYADVVKAPGIAVAMLIICAVVRIVICLFPQNNWFKKEGNRTFGIARNIPFAFVGLIMIALFVMVGKWDMSIAIFFSFTFYFPVVLWGKVNPKIGMLMMPKTIMYMWMIGMGLALL